MRTTSEKSYCAERRSAMANARRGKHLRNRGNRLRFAPLIQHNQRPPNGASLTLRRLTVLALVMGCQHPPATRSVEIPMGFEANAPVEVWVTTGDQAKLLARDGNLPLFYNTTLSMRVTVVAVDPGKTYQQIIGYGAAMTDASAFLIQNKMSAADREALLQDLFGRENGIGMSFIRVPMGASDFSQRHYSYDDMPAGQNDSALAHFSIDADRVEKLTLLRRAMAINPQLEVMASPWSPPAWM